MKKRWRAICILQYKSTRIGFGVFEWTLWGVKNIFLPVVFIETFFRCYFDPIMENKGFEYLFLAGAFLGSFIYMRWFIRVFHKNADRIFQKIRNDLNSDFVPNEKLDRVE